MCQCLYVFEVAFGEVFSDNDFTVSLDVVDKLVPDVVVIVVETVAELVELLLLLLE